MPYNNHLFLLFRIFFGSIWWCLVPYFRNKVQAANRYILMNGKQTIAFLLVPFCLLTGCSRKSCHDDALIPIRLAASLQARSAIDIFEDLPVALVAGRLAGGPGGNLAGHCRRRTDYAHSFTLLSSGRKYPLPAWFRLVCPLHTRHGRTLTHYITP